MKNENRYYHILKLFCKKNALFLDKQIKGNKNNIKEIWIKLAIKGAIKKVGCRNFRISENNMT